MKEKEGEEYQPAGAIAAGGHGGVAGSRALRSRALRSPPFHLSLRGAVAATGSKGGGGCSTLTTAWPVTSHRMARQLLGCSLAVNACQVKALGEEISAAGLLPGEENYFPM